MERIKVSTENGLTIKAIKVKTVSSESYGNSAIVEHLCYAQNRLFIGKENYEPEYALDDTFNKEYYNSLMEDGEEETADLYLESHTSYDTVSKGVVVSEILVEYCVIPEYDKELYK